MHLLTRLAVAGYILVLTLALLAGRWPLQGPVLLTFGFFEGRGLHVGDVFVLAVSTAVAGAVLVERP